MHAQQASEEFRTTQLASAIAATMNRMGVAALPCNYEIFYEALIGANQDLVRDLAALGRRPKQEELDKLAVTHRARSNGQKLVEDSRDQIARSVEQILGLMEKERVSLEKFNAILEETSSGLAQRETLTRDLLNGIIGVMTVATKSTSTHGRQLASSMADKSTELEAVKAKLEEYKKLAETDSLTQLQNRRAFDREITRIFSSKRRLMFCALILADIDRFKPVNDRYGHPIGDRILQIVAAVIRSNVSDSVFVARTGGEEFALIVDGFSETATVHMANQIRNAIMETPFINMNTGANYGPITVSMGVCMASEADNADDLYTKADRALYASKTNGRNQVTLHSELAPGSFTKSWLLYRKE